MLGNLTNVNFGEEKMSKKQMKTYRKNERGNVLFLILIAVALFAALSYAVTSSTRSGGGDAGDETSLISSSQVTQYPSSVRTAIIRQIISQNVDPTELEFNPPSAFSNLSSATDSSGVSKKIYGVFHPDGGGAVYAKAPPEVMANASPGTWYFSGEFEIENIRTSSDSSGDGNDIIAFLPGVKNTVCRKINDELGIADGTDGNETSFLAVTNVLAGADLSGSTGGYTDELVSTGSGTSFPSDEDDLGVTGTAAGLSGQPYGCFVNGTDDDDFDDDWVYYHVLVER